MITGIVAKVAIKTSTREYIPLFLDGRAQSRCRCTPRATTLGRRSTPSCTTGRTEANSRMWPLATYPIFFLVGGGQWASLFRQIWKTPLFATILPPLH